MSKNLLRGVTGFTDPTFSLVISALRGENFRLGLTAVNLLLIFDKTWFPMYPYPNLTQTNKKVHWATLFRPDLGGVDENVRVFPASVGFGRSGAPERR